MIKICQVFKVLELFYSQKMASFRYLPNDHLKRSFIKKFCGWKEICSGHVFLYM